MRKRPIVKENTCKAIVTKITERVTKLILAPGELDMTQRKSNFYTKLSYTEPTAAKD